VLACSGDVHVLQAAGCCSGSGDEWVVRGSAAAVGKCTCCWPQAGIPFPVPDNVDVIPGDYEYEYVAEPVGGQQPTLLHMCCV
jgi:hypothetical protein